MATATATATASQAIEVIRQVAETIRECKTIPSGSLYTVLMGRGLNLRQYEAIIGILKRSDLIEVSSAHMIRWIGPEVGA